MQRGGAGGIVPGQAAGVLGGKLGQRHQQLPPADPRHLQALRHVAGADALPLVELLRRTTGRFGDTLYRKPVLCIPRLVHGRIGADAGVEGGIVGQPGDVGAAAVRDKILAQQGAAAAVQGADLHAGAQLSAHAVVRVGGINPVEHAVLRKGAALGQAQPRLTDPGVTVGAVVGTAGPVAQHPLDPGLQVHGGEAAGIIEIGGGRLIQLPFGGAGSIAARPDHVQGTGSGRGVRGVGGGCPGCLGGIRGIGQSGGMGRSIPGLSRAGAQGQHDPKGQRRKSKPFHVSSPSSR